MNSPALTSLSLTGNALDAEAAKAIQAALSQPRSKPLPFFLDFSSFALFPCFLLPCFVSCLRPSSGWRCCCFACCFANNERTALPFLLTWCLACLSPSFSCWCWCWCWWELVFVLALVLMYAAPHALSLYLPACSCLAFTFHLSCVCLHAFPLHFPCVCLVSSCLAYVGPCIHVSYMLYSDCLASPGLALLCTTRHHTTHRRCALRRLYLEHTSLGKASEDFISNGVLTNRCLALVTLRGFRLGVSFARLGMPPQASRWVVLVMEQGGERYSHHAWA